MTTPYRRGHIAGADAARAFRFLFVTGLIGPTFVQALATVTWDEQKAAGYAPIEPREEWMRGFMDGVTESIVLLQGANHVYNSNG